MGRKVSVLGAVALVAALVMASGCSGYSATTRSDAGSQVSQKSFHLWPVLYADRTVYERGVLNQGEFLLFMHWRDFHPTKQACQVPLKPVDRAISADAGAAAAPPAAPSESPAE